MRYWTVVHQGSVGRASPSTPDLGPIRDYLRDHVVVAMADRSAGNSWVEDLQTSDIGMQLGACIAIDVATGSLKADQFVEVLSDMPKAGEPHCRFSSGLESNHALLGQCGSSFHKHGGGQYARVLEIGVFTDRYAGPTYHMTLSPASVERVRRMFMDSGATHTLGDIRRPWRGRLPIVWVLPVSELEKILHASPPDKVGTYINDCLGLALDSGWGADGRPELMAVRYPPDFSERCAQPTTLDTLWATPHFFLSGTAGDAWGTTQSCSGTTPGCPERVHPELRDGLTDGFSCVYIGVSEPIAQDREALLKEALERFKKTQL